MDIPKRLYKDTEIRREDVKGGSAAISLAELDVLPKAENFVGAEKAPVATLIPEFEGWSAVYLEDPFDDVEGIPDVLTCPAELTWAAAPHEWYMHQTARLVIRIVVQSVDGPACLGLRTAGNETVSADVLSRIVDRVVRTPKASELKRAKQYQADGLLDVEDSATALFRLALELPGRIGDLARTVKRRSEPERDLDRAQSRSGQDVPEFLRRLWIDVES
ncbi:hypothetical protein ACT3TD_13920 [Corynebacterium sp. AOP36-E1-14]|uniref:hypothetical protein n=1 Tax=unclassified Corynebacterium TaxID=2624378 RepID=UPI0040338EF5